MARLKTRLRRLYEKIAAFFNDEPIDEEAMKAYLQTQISREARKQKKEKQQKALLELFGLTEEDITQLQQQQEAK